MHNIPIHKTKIFSNKVANQLREDTTKKFLDLIKSVDNKSWIASKMSPNEMGFAALAIAPRGLGGNSDFYRLINKRGYTIDLSVLRSNIRISVVNYCSRQPKPVYEFNIQRE